MAIGASLTLFHQTGAIGRFGGTNHFKSSEIKSWRHVSTNSVPSSFSLRQDVWSVHISDRIFRPIYYIPYRYNTTKIRASTLPNPLQSIPIVKSSSLALTRSYNALLASPVTLQVVPAIGLMVFAMWGLLPLMHSIRNLFHNENNNWKKSKTYHISSSYLQPLLLWAGATLICRALDPVVLPSEASQAVKLRLLNFVRSLSIVLAFAFCLSGLIQQTQKFFMETGVSNDTRNMGFQFAGKAVYTAVWVAAFSLFMELLGFSTQKWITAGGLGTVLLTLAGREIFTNFLSSVMIHATRPFVVNEWIQTKIEGYEVSGTVEHVGWWSPTIIRGDDREAVHIPNHKFTVSVVRNLSQKSHWRIKTHLAISHLDVSKINNIVADMRKVLAKHPQIEQQRLHRRVFLDNINPENQALLILVSCFVKTSHFEEYLCVKEAILLDLLRVISHHRARLATPIRTVQKIYGDADMENIPYSETMYNRPGNPSSRPFLLIEPQTSKINGEDKPNKKSTPPSDTSPNQNSDNNKKKTNSKDGKNETPAAAAAESGNESGQGDIRNNNNNNSNNSKGESEKAPQVARPTFQDNIVLGVALEGSKRTLPIEEGMSPPSGPGVSETGEMDKVGPAPGVKDKKNQGKAVDQRDGTER